MAFISLPKLGSEHSVQFSLQIGTCSDIQIWFLVSKSMQSLGLFNIYCKSSDSLHPMALQRCRSTAANWFSSPTVTSVLSPHVPTVGSKSQTESRNFKEQRKERHQHANIDVGFKMAFGKRTPSNSGTKNILQTCEATHHLINKYLINKECFMYTCHELIYITEQSCRWDKSNLTQQSLGKHLCSPSRKETGNARSLSGAVQSQIQMRHQLAFLLTSI